METHTFTRLIKALLDDGDYQELQEILITRPDAGDLIKNSGGLRKIRWNLPGKGKSHGVRVIYYWAAHNDQIYMLYVYSKSRQKDLTSEQLQQLKVIIKRW